MKRIFLIICCSLCWYVLDNLEVNAVVTPISYQIAEALKVNPELVKLKNELNCVFTFASTAESLTITTNDCGEDLNYENMITSFTFNKSVITYVVPDYDAQLSLDAAIIIPQLVNSVSTLLGYSSQEVTTFLNGRKWSALTFANNGIEATMMSLDGEARTGDVFSSFKLDVNNLFGQNKILWVDDSTDLNPPQDETPTVPQNETPPKETNNLPPNPETGSYLPLLMIGIGLGLITIFNIVYKRKSNFHKI